MNLRNILVASCALSMMATPAFSQESEKLASDETVEYSSKRAVETNSFKYNWFFSLGAGGQIYFGDHNKQVDFGDKIAPALDVMVGKWIIPSLGIRLGYSGLQAKGATQNNSYTDGQDVPGKGPGYWLKKQKFNMMNFHADVLFNMSNIICGYNEKRVWNVSPYIGLGYAHVYDTPHNNCVTANLGVFNSFRLSGAFDINLDFRGTLLNDKFDGEEGHRFGEGMFTATVGIAYKFKPRGWNRSKTVVRYNNDQINALREQLKQANAENKRLQEALAAGNTKEAETIIRQVAATNLVVFNIGKSDLTNQARVNVGILADVIKSSDNKAIYTITGYADAGTGSKELNQRLSKERADAVYNCLVKEFGVNPSQLKVEYKGGVDNMFYNDPRLSRAVVTYNEF